MKARPTRTTQIASTVLALCGAWLRRPAAWLKAVALIVGRAVGRPLAKAWRVLQPPPERSEHSYTRKPLPFWDRVKFLLLLALLWFILVWSVMASDPIIGFRDALATEVQTGWWVFVLFGLELVRQINYVISEHWAGYYRFWAYHFFGGVERTSQRNLSPWTRFRLRRVLIWVFWIAVVAIVAGKVTHSNALDALSQMPRYIWDALPFVLQIVVILLFVVAQFGMLFWFLSRGGVDVYYPDDVETRFSDVWGQDRVLERVKENILYLERPELIESRGGYVPGGILLWGPPGTGKTLMAEAVAGETGKPYVFVDPGAFINMFMGVGILKVKSLFRKLRRLALRYGGVIVFFDEADSLGRRGALAQGGPNFPRASAASAAWQTSGCNGFSYLTPDSQWRLAQRTLASSVDDEPGVRRHKQMMGMGMNGGGMGTLQALLSELSGLTKPRGFLNRYGRRLLGMRPKPPPKYRILVMMATNLPEALDEALLRPGRIDRIYKVGYPSKAGRMRTYLGYLAKVQHQLTMDDVDKLAVITPYATGASMKDLVNEALIMAIRNGRDVITWPDVMKAKQLKELGPPDDVEYIERERHAVAVHEACHAVVAHRTRRHTQIDIATIEKASDYLGMVTRIPPEEQFTHWRSEYESDILCSLASLAGERMFFDDDSSSGVSGDLESATAVASFMEGYWGMGSTVSSYSTAKRLEVGAPGGGQGGRNKKGQDTELELRRALADRIEDSLGGLLTRARQILRENRAEVLSLAHALEMHKTLSGEDVVAVIERQRGPIVDGTVYADARFMQEIEDYHRGAAAAHREHSQILLTLPEPPWSALTVPAAAWYAVPDGRGAGDHQNGGPAVAPGPAVGLTAPGVPADQGNGSARAMPYQSRWLVTADAPAEPAPPADAVPAAEPAPEAVAAADPVLVGDTEPSAEAEPPAQAGSGAEAGSAAGPGSTAQAGTSGEEEPSGEDRPAADAGPASTP